MRRETFQTSSQRSFFHLLTVHSQVFKSWHKLCIFSFFPHVSWQHRQMDNIITSKLIQHFQVKYWKTLYWGVFDRQQDRCLSVPPSVIVPVVVLDLMRWQKCVMYSNRVYRMMWSGTRKGGFIIQVKNQVSSFCITLLCSASVLSFSFSSTNLITNKIFSNDC